MNQRSAPRSARVIAAVVLLATVPFVFFTGLFIPEVVTWVCMAFTTAVSVYVLFAAHLSVRSLGLLVAAALGLSAFMTFAGPPLFGWSAYTPVG